MFKVLYIERLTSRIKFNWNQSWTTLWKITFTCQNFRNFSISSQCNQTKSTLKKQRRFMPNTRLKVKKLKERFILCLKRKQMFPLLNECLNSELKILSQISKTNWMRLRAWRYNLKKLSIKKYRKTKSKFLSMP